MTRSDIEPAAGAPMAIRATIVVPMRDREAFITQLLESLLAQWQPGLELLLIDDASQDATLTRVMDVLERRPDVDAVLMRLGEVQGMRLIGMVQQVARGAIIIQADSDDISFPDRLTRLLACFDADDTCRLVTSNAVLLSPEGLACGLLDTQLPDAVLSDALAVGLVGGDPRRLGATMAYHRHVYDMFPTIDPDLCPYGLDLILPLRAVLLGSHHYLATPLVGWRQHRANTHRLAGLHATGAVARERYQAFELMALAQSVRDVDALQAARPPGALAALAEALRKRLSVEFDRWCRLRTLVVRDGAPDAERTRQAAFVPTIAPIPSLRIGETLHFGSRDDRARLMTSAAGMHAPEAWGMWTQRVAQFNVRIQAAEVSRLRLSFSMVVPGTLPGERIAIAVEGASWVEGVARDGRDLTMDVSYATNKPAPILSVVVLARDAAVPKEIGVSQETRLIGVGLVGLTCFAD